MKGIWQPSPLDRGFPQIELWKSAGCNRGYFAARYPVWNADRQHYEWFDNTQQLNNTFRSDVTKAGIQFGIFRDPHWDGINDYNQLAQLAHDDINKATEGSNARQCAYMFDIEFPYRDGNWLLALFKAFRKLRPGRLLSWTMEPLQGGWIKGFPALVDWINHDINFVVVVQNFFGNMDPAGADALRENMKQTGIDPRRVRIFHDAAKPRPSTWDGCLFHAERLVVTAKSASTSAPLEAVPPTSAAPGEENALEHWRNLRAAV